jgi:hypothetical protein
MDYIDKCVTTVLNLVRDSQKRTLGAKPVGNLSRPIRAPARYRPGPTELILWTLPAEPSYKSRF